MLRDADSSGLARRVMIHAMALLFSLATIDVARAQIYEWVDDANVRHYANSLDRIPEEHRDGAKLIVGALPVAPESPPASEPGEAEREMENEERFASGWDAGFDAGWEAGFRAAEEQQPVCPAAPVVVTMESPPVVLNVPRYDPSGAYYRSPYAGGLTVPFDDGASRGLTQRQRIQELRTRERGW
jgi:hypothetical protein